MFSLLKLYQTNKLRKYFFQAICIGWISQNAGNTEIGDENENELLNSFVSLVVHFFVKLDWWLLFYLLKLYQTNKMEKYFLRVRGCGGFHYVIMLSFLLMFWWNILFAVYYPSIFSQLFFPPPPFFFMMT